MKIALEDPLPRIARAIHDAGGRALLVGGSVRDALLGVPSQDVDIEIFGLSLDAVCAVLSQFGEIVHIGRAFAVLRVKGVDADFSLPRRDSKVGRGHKGFHITYDPSMSFEEAARRRDVTINSVGYDILTGELLDPHGGQKDLEAKRLRATDPEHFAEDPLRGLRVARFAAVLEMTPDAELRRLCSELDLRELSPERVFEELNRLLLEAERPSIGFEFLREIGLLRFFPEIQALVGAPQDPDWHPEGDVFVHTMMVLDEAARLRRADDEDLPLMYAALCHDFGKPQTTERLDGRLRSYEHDVVGASLSETFLRRLRAPSALIDAVAVLVRHHLAPSLYYKHRAKAKAYRRLARALEAGGATMELLLRVATADHFGRTTEDAKKRSFPAGEHFREQMERLEIEEKAPKDVVLGRHLIARGLRPSKSFGRILAKCREVQDETGWDDPYRILDAVLEKGDFE